MMFEMTYYWHDNLGIQQLLEHYFFTYSWRMVVHVGVNGYSRVPVFLHCSNNNKACTVLELFEKAVVEWGLTEKKQEVKTQAHSSV